MSSQAIKKLGRRRTSNQHFFSDGLKVYRNLVKKAAKGDKYDEEYDFVVSFYEGDLNPTRLKSQLELLCTHFTAHASTLSFMDVIHFLKDLCCSKGLFL